MDTQVIILTDKPTALLIAEVLTDMSVWFAMDPWPNDQFAISVKDEAAERLRGIIAAAA